MIQIRKEVEEVITGQQPKDNNVLKNAPHSIDVLTVSEQEWNKCAYLFIQPFLALRRLADLIPAKRQHIPWRGSSSASSGPQYLV